MTDNEIKQALEKHSKVGWFYLLHDCSWEAVTHFLDTILDLINRLEADKEALIAGQETLQKSLAEKNAEIEKLTVNLKFVRGTVERQKADNERLKKLLDDKCDRCIEKERAEAVKEFAERLLEAIREHHYLLSDHCKSRDYGMFTIGIEQAIGETKKEMVGDAE